MIKIGLFGCGTVGQGLIKILQSNTTHFKLSAVVDRSFRKKQDILKNIPSSDDPQFILDNPEIDVIVELMGGVELPLYIIREALDRGKNVITANKFLLAEHGYALLNKANDKNLKIGFEAAIAGGIPIVRNLENIFFSEKIPMLEGILNGTTNFILTKMRKEKKDFDVVLKESQELGLAEADPTLDINGSDAVHKLALLGSLVTKKWIDYKNIYTRGIEKIKINDIFWTEKMGFRIRLLAQFKNVNNQYFFSVEPRIIKPGHYLWDIEFENNAIMFKGEYSQTHLFMGKGAGSLPTAYSVFSDLMHYYQGNYSAFRDADIHWEYEEIASNDDNVYPCYFRLQVTDKPGVLAELSGILGRYNISVASVHQDALEEGENNLVDVMILTHQAKRSMINKAIEEIERQSDYIHDYFFMPVDENR